MSGRGSNEGSSRRNAYWSWREAVSVSNYGWLVNAALALFLGYLVADRRGSAAVLGLGSPALWKSVLLIGGILLAGGLSMGATSFVAYQRTGIVYASDRAGFARMGGFDIGRAPMLVAQLGFLGAFWITTRFRPDVLDGARTPWAYLLSSTFVGLVATVLIADHHFRAKAETAKAETAKAERARAQTAAKRRRRPLLPVGVRVTELSATRLSLSHPKLLVGITVAVACGGIAVAVGLGMPWGLSPVTHWAQSGAGKWTVIAIASAVGIISLLLASNRRIVFDKTAQLLQVRDRYAWGRTTPRGLPLQDVSAVVVRRETMGSSQLTNVCVRAGDKTYPVIIGSRLASNARDLALVIGRFLDVPAYEDERLLAITPDASVADILDVIDDLRHGGQEHLIDSGER